MFPYFTEHFGNPSSRYHLYGWEAEEAVDHARVLTAKLIGARPAEIVFTGGATESCNLAIKGLVESTGNSRGHIITLATEHKAVLETLAYLERKGCEISRVDVDRNGLPDPEEIEKAIKPSTLLIAMMYANNETGVIMPVREVAAIAEKHGVLFFSDATQAAGKIPVDAVSDGIHLMAFTAHKMYGPKGTGALYIRGNDPRVRVKAMLNGGDHERGMRSGTLNVPGIVGLGEAARIAADKLVDEGERLLGQRKKLEEALLNLPGVHLNGHPNNRLPHITNISIEQVEAEQLLLGLSNRLALGTGSACSSVTLEPSHVLTAMGVASDLLYRSVRISQGRFTTEEDTSFAADVLIQSISGLRSEYTGHVSNRLQPSSFSVLPE
jgi:cysteine desulfurase